MLLTNEQKRIYNVHLSISRSVKNKPYKLRSNFDNIDSKDELMLKKLSQFFSKYPSVNLSDFFIAPYKVYDQDGYFDLFFYTTPKATKCYTLYMQQRETDNPDSDDIINACKDSCKYIYNFCRENNITLHEYKSLQTGAVPDFLVHLKEHKINFYTLHGLDNDRELRRVEKDLIDFYVKDFDKLIVETRINFLKSDRLKHIVRGSLSIVENLLLKNKTQSL